MSDLAGQLDIQLRPDARTVARITSSRPLSAAGVFVGKPVARVAGQLPLLFSVCGTAQAVACAQACEAALGLAPAPSAQAARILLLRAETAKEHLWRLLLDWPAALARLDVIPEAVQLAAQSAEREAAMAAAMRAFLQLRAALGTGGDPFLPGADRIRPAADAVESARAILAETATEQVLGVPAARWLAAVLTPTDLRHWAAQTATPAAALVRALTAAGLADVGRCAIDRLSPGVEGSGLLRQLAPILAAADADDFVAAPHLQGVPRETSPFAREVVRGELVSALAAAHGNGLLPRLAALLTELARQTVQLGLDAEDTDEEVADAAMMAAAAPDAGVGLGAAAAARGLLVHRVAIAGSNRTGGAQVRGYRILAPTEWNFHPAGVVADGLADVAMAWAERRVTPTPAQLEALARLYVTAVDPCVDYRLSIS
ncbi:hypothetical protein [uncultured Thiohalocapsa sp.]|uniref:hypothetical protein n=1 Tax=uncultured Thiohalocapsa sp. TaxID=768990 RepID=UPI0025D07330|nr:hypothetical protein [uncultured Thiohalocapsa sp.]